MARLPHLRLRLDLQPSLWESATAATPSPSAGASPSALAEVPGHLGNTSDASPQPQQVAAPVGSAPLDSRAVKPSESHRRRSPVQRHEQQRQRAASVTPAQPIGEPLVWGAWPTAEEPLVIVSDGVSDGDGAGDSGSESARRWVFVGPFACGKELLGVLLAPWEQRSERERVEQRWVAIERVRRVIESTAKGK